IKTYPKNLLKDDQRNLILTPLIRIILDQKKSVDELIKILSTVEQSAPITTIQADLAALQASYRSLNIEEQIKNNNSAMVLTDKDLIEITRIVEKMKKDIID
ncbi:MAG: hypothetical protein ORN54_11105, partial [Cyclobacteriaceae bacterium]|nr:hypothetical protein [Cyclobacteriaceae bacterium]